MSSRIEDDPWIGSAPNAQAVRVPKALLWVLGGCGLVSVLTVGGLLAFGIAMESGRIPDSAAVPGAQVRRQTLRILRDEHLIEADERVLYFYSGAALNLREHGSFFTDERVVDYETVDDEIAIDEARYEEIAAIEFTATEGFFGDSTLLIRCDDGREIDFDVANEGGGAKAFEELLRRTWQRQRSALDLPEDGRTITAASATPEVSAFLRDHALLDEGEEFVALLGVPDAPLANWGVLCTDVKLAIYGYEKDPMAAPWELQHTHVVEIRRGKHADPLWVRFEVVVEGRPPYDVDFYGTEAEVARFEALWLEAWRAARSR